MSDETPDKPKIIVDEDWKSQVEAEKKSAKKTEQQPPATGEAPRVTELPPASFPMLVQMLFMQAMVALGQVGPPDQEEVVVELDVAKHLIDLLAVLEEKTKGNLSQEDEAVLTRVLHELRLLFVAVKQHAKPRPAEKASGIVTE